MTAHPTALLDAVAADPLPSRQDDRAHILAADHLPSRPDWRRKGLYRRAPAEDRFWAKVAGGAVDECWIWCARKRPDGYGTFWPTPKRGVAAHRWAYEHLRSAIPQGLVLDHLCRNPPCVNPWHLEPVTDLENVRRGIGHGSETHCPSGHPYSGPNLIVTPKARRCRICRNEQAGRYRAAARARAARLKEAS